MKALYRRDYLEVKGFLFICIWNGIFIIQFSATNVPWAPAV